MTPVLAIFYFWAGGFVFSLFTNFLMDSDEQDEDSLTDWEKVVYSAGWPFILILTIIEQIDGER